jgi:hypothetical protein
VTGRGFDEAAPGVLAVFGRRRAVPQRLAGAVVFDPEDGHLGAVGQPPSGAVQLPAAVARGVGEPPGGRLRPFLRLRGDQAASNQDPVDRRDRGRAQSLRAHPLGDRPGTVVPALRVQLLTQPYDRVLDTRRCPPRRAVRPARARQQRLDPARGEPLAGLVVGVTRDPQLSANGAHPATSHAVAGQQRRQLLLHRDRPLPHDQRGPWRRSDCQRCAETSVSEL